MTFISYLKLYIVIDPEKQGDGVTTDAAEVHSMHRSFKDVVFGIYNILIVSGSKERGVLDHRAN
jgi:hypothetical protein